MFNLCSRNPSSSRTFFAATGVTRVMPVLGIAADAGQMLFSVSVLKIDPSGGSGS